MRKKPIIGLIGGTGKMGQWLRFFFEKQGLKVLIAGRKTPLTIKECAKRANIIIVCVPISAVEQVIKDIAPFVGKNALLTDITSVKVGPLEAMKKAKSATLGMHPLFGPTVGELTGQTIVFCRQKDNKHIDFLKDLFQKSGINIVEMEAEDHDMAVAHIQALTHAINLLLVKSLTTNDKFPVNIQTPVFSLQTLVMDRVLEQDLSLLADIQLYNPYFLPILKKFLINTSKLALTIGKKDKKRFVNMFSSFTKHTTNQIALPLKIKKNGISPQKKIAYLGPEGTYSYEATRNIFPENRLISCPTLYDVFSNVETGKAELAVVAVENSIGGTVAETLDYLTQFNFCVIGSYQLPIHHYLVSKEKSLKKTKTVISHPQAIAQCRLWLRNNLANAIVTSAQSTTSELLKAKKNYAYIASPLSAQKYGLNILAKNIEDSPFNKTKFYVVAKKPISIKGLENNKTLLFLSVYDRVGILRDILDVLASYGINLSKLESRPSRIKPWDYHFFVEVEKVSTDKTLVKALEELKAYCPIIRILGQT